MNVMYDHYQAYDESRYTSSAIGVNGSTSGGPEQSMEVKLMHCCRSCLESEWSCSTSLPPRQAKLRRSLIMPLPLDMHKSLIVV